VSSRLLTDLHPIVKMKALELITLASAEGIPLLVTNTLRSFDEQDVLWEQGRGAPGRIVTNAKGGETPHNFGLAFDVVPLTPEKKPWWDAPPPIWARLYKLAEKVGLDALGDRWGEFLSWDKGHFQEPGWKLVASAIIQEDIGKRS